MRPVVLLSFDVEEFDMPIEYGNNIPLTLQLELGKKGLDALQPILQKPNISTTLFTTANFADHYPESIQALSVQHEIASHTYYHSKFETADLAASKHRLEAITGKPVTGLRMPRMKQVPVQDMIDAGYQYDASIHPTWLPGRYNNLHLPRTIFQDQGLLRVPASVSPILRLPLFWLSFKNFPFAFYQKLAVQTLRKDGYLSLYYHPWEFTDVRNLGLPTYTIRHCSGLLLERLYKLIELLEKEAVFMTMQDYVHHNFSAH